ncbi:uncharacterized protein VTP21DRAFT_1534 [Calcarisporiella thermophila]|uniref:uncharacterized protein n=1 Tax=Calcarisporiella thermophila TaxID=911321 RepID=UPI0037444CCE
MSFPLSLPLDYAEEISTIFVVGFPEDMKEREFQNMFTFCPGFEAAILKLPSLKDNELAQEKIIGFAKFRTQQEALQALSILSGRRVDVERGSILKAKMAKKNLHIKRSGEHLPFPSPPASTGGLSSYDLHPNPLSLPADLLSPTEYNYDIFTETSSNYISTSLSGTEQRRSLKADTYDLNGIPRSRSVPTSTPSVTPGDIWSITKGFGALELGKSVGKDDIAACNSLALPPSPVTPIFPLSSSTKNQYPFSWLVPSLNPADQNPPCNTLYVGNLPANASEEEIRHLFSRSPGYHRLSFRTKGNSPMCFVEFENVEYAMQALMELQGTILKCSTRGGIRLSFSKNPLGVRKQSHEVRPVTTNTLPSFGSRIQATSHNFNQQ